MPTRNFDLFERCSYECWLLEAIYAIENKRLFTEKDSLIFPPDGELPKNFNYGAVHMVIGDWRPKFREIAAPLVLVTGYKVLDMLVEWTINDPKLWKFSEKKKALGQGVTFESSIEARPWLKERLIALYGKLDSVRSTIIHDRHFTTTNGELEVRLSKGQQAGSLIHLASGELHSFAWIVVMIVRWICGDWIMDGYLEKKLRLKLDELQPIHGCATLGQKPPLETVARIYVLDGQPIEIDVAAIRAALVHKIVHSDVMFDVRVVIVGSDKQSTRALRVPWDELSDPALKRYGVPEEKESAFATSVPNDVDQAAAYEALKTKFDRFGNTSTNSP